MQREQKRFEATAQVTQQMREQAALAAQINSIAVAKCTPKSKVKLLLALCHR